MMTTKSEQLGSSPAAARTALTVGPSTITAVAAFWLVLAGSAFQVHGQVPQANSPAPDGTLVRQPILFDRQSRLQQGVEVEHILLDDVNPQPQYYLRVYSRVLGTSLVPIDDVLGAQLKLQKNRGLVVSEVFPGSSAAKAGLKQHDILYSIGETPLKSIAELKQAVQDAGEKSIDVTIIRQGKQQQVQLSPAEKGDGIDSILKPESLEIQSTRQYWIGVSLSSVTPALRTQLKLPENQGAAVTQVVADSPAEKAGIEPFDIILKIDDEVIASVEDVQTEVRNSVGKKMGLTVMRGGETLTIEVTPAKLPRQPYVVLKRETKKSGKASDDDEIHTEHRLNWTQQLGFPKTLSPGAIIYRPTQPIPPVVVAPPLTTPPASLDERLSKTMEQLDSIRQELESLRREYRRHTALQPQPAQKVESKK